jgi:hypothetical protein
MQWQQSTTAPNSKAKHVDAITVSMIRQSLCMYTGIISVVRSRKKRLLGDEAELQGGVSVELTGPV